MIKIVFCLRRLPALTAEQFQEYWLQRHAPLVKQHAAALRIKGYTQNHHFTDDRIMAAVNARGATAAAYDGVAEIWWDSVEDIIEAGNSAAGRAAGRALLADERKFIDLPNSPIFYTRAHAIIP